MADLSVLTILETITHKTKHPINNHRLHQHSCYEEEVCGVDDREEIK